VLNKIANRLIKFLLIPPIRLYFCKARWRWLRKNLKVYDNPSAGVDEIVVKYNLTGFDSDAAFGCGGRMDLLLYPLKALSFDSSPKVLIVGPRTEDDIFLAKALGLNDSRGMDLFSYSPHIDLGDIHEPKYDDGKFDAVVLGWVLVYCGNPQKVIEQCRRILKKGGLLAIGWEWVPEDQRKESKIRGNPLNSIEEISSLIGGSVVFMYDPVRTDNHYKAAIFQT